MQLANYLFFRNGCEDALEFYTQCGLGRVVALVRHGDYGPPVKESMRGKVLHSEFAGPGVHFYASDNHDAEPMRGSAHFLVLDHRQELDDLFARMSVGANVTTPVSAQPWGYYGKLTDRFGVQWMFNVAA
ncbi:MAG: VOC family protein [Povalibacter sp.]